MSTTHDTHTIFGIAEWTYEQRDEVANALDLIVELDADLLVDEPGDEDVADEMVRLDVLAAALRSQMSGERIESFVQLDGLGDSLAGSINDSLANIAGDDPARHEAWVGVLSSVAEGIVYPY